MEGTNAGGDVSLVNVNGPAYFGVSEGAKNCERIPPRLCRIPFLPLNGKFAGRVSLLADLTKNLCERKASVLRQAEAIYADGGVGKTALAVELGWRLFAEGVVDYVFFLSAATEAALGLDQERLCEKDALNLSEQAALDSPTRRRAVLGWFHDPLNAGRTLLILDGADEPEARAAVRTLLPQLSGCAVLITSRHKGWVGVTEHPLDLFTPEEAREFLRCHLPESLLADPCADAWLDGIAQEVDHLPLALEIVASYLKENRQSPGEWLKEWREAPTPTIEHHNPDAIHYPRSLARVWEQSEARLSQPARALLHQLAWVAPRPAALPLAVFKEQPSWVETRKGLSELAKASLITWPEDSDGVSVHRILQAVLRHRLTDEDKGVALSATLKTISAALPNPRWSEKGWRLWEHLAAHCHSLLAHLRDSKEEPASPGLMNQLGLWYLEQASYSEAEPLMRRALAIDEQSLGSDHPNVAIRLNNLALLLQHTDRLAEAEPLMRRALAIDERSLGSDHPDVAIRLNNLAQLLQDTDRPAQAEPLMQRALGIFEKSLGIDHPNTIVARNNLVLLVVALRTGPLK